MYEGREGGVAVDAPGHAGALRSGVGCVQHCSTSAAMRFFFTPPGTYGVYAHTS